MYTPVSSLEAFVIVKFALTLVIFPGKLSLTDTLSLKVPLVLFHTIVGGGYPIVSHIISVELFSLIITVVMLLTGFTILAETVHTYTFLISPVYFW